MSNCDERLNSERSAAVKGAHVLDVSPVNYASLRVPLHAHTRALLLDDWGIQHIRTPCIEFV